MLKKRIIAFALAVVTCAAGAFGSLSSGDIMTAKAIDIVDNESTSDEVYCWIGNKETLKITLPQTTYVHTKKAITPVPTVEYRKLPTTSNPYPAYRTLTAGTDYTVSYSDNVEVGTATIKITGKGLYFGSSSTTFSIVHNYSTEWTVDKAATCSSEGSKSHHCTVCGDKSDITPIAKTEHSYTEKVTKAATCTATGIKTFSCSCGASYTETIPATGHSYKDTVVEPTTEEMGYTLHECKNCDYSYKDNYISVKVHQYSSSITKEATCTGEGERTYTCSECGDSYVESIPALGHSYNSTIVNPTYSSMGYTLHKCSRCGHSYKDSYRTKLTLSEPSSFKVEAVSSSSIRVTWAKDSTADGYIVCKYDPTTKKIVRVGKTTSNVLSVKGLDSATSYVLYVRSYKKVGSSYVYSGYSSCTGITNPTVPKGFVTEAVSASSIRVGWDKSSDADGYIVYKYDTAAKKAVRVGKTANSVLSVKGLKSGTGYTLYVRSYKKVGSGYVYSGYSKLTATTNPAKVSFSLTAGSNKATVKWRKVTGASGYIVYYKTSAGGSWVRLTKTTGTSFTKTGLRSGKTYYFTVRAYKSFGGKIYYGGYSAQSVKVK